MHSLPLIRIGTRKSVLALAQAEIVKQKLLAVLPALKVELVPMTTSGDQNTHTSLADIGGKGLFTKELEEALLADAIDIAVHSLKDMETHLPPGLFIGAVLPRDDPRDVLIAPHATSLADLPRGARVGTSSPRRTAQLRIFRPDLEIVSLRGNVTTRIIKIKNGDADATLLALAGLKRIHMENEVTEILNTEDFTPAAGQGALAAECKETNGKMRELLAHIDDTETHTAILAERSLLATLGGSCRTPIAAYARMEDTMLRLDAMVAKPDGSQFARVTRRSPPADAKVLGEETGRELLAQGGKECLA